MRNNRTIFNLTPRGFATLTVAALILIAAGAAQTVSAQQYASKQALSKFVQQGDNAAANAVFNSGRDLIDNAQWAKAEEKFGQYIATYKQEKNLDAAMFWQAYAQAKLKQYAKSKDTVEKLLKTYDKTIWKEDAQMLLAQLPNGVKVKVEPTTVEVDPVDIQIRVQDIQERTAEAQARAQERAAEAQARAEERAKEAQERSQEQMKEIQERLKDRTLDRFDFDFRDFAVSKGQSTANDDPCEFRIVVLQALFESDVQRGIAAATDWLKAGSTETPRCKSAALSLLARHGGKAATPTILGVAQRETDLKVRTRAISVLGMTNDDSVVDPLRDFALNATQTEISEAALFALSQHSSPRAIEALTEISTSNKPMALRKTAISNIANRQGEPAVDALFKIYDTDQNLEIRKAVISGFGHRRSDRVGTKLMEIARGSDNVELRKAAISAIGRRGGDQAVDSLMSLYDAEKNEEIKTQVLNSLAYSNDAKVIHKLITIAKDPQTPIERKRRIIMLLAGHSKNPEVIAYFEELLKQ